MKRSAYYSATEIEIGGTIPAVMGCIHLGKLLNNAATRAIRPDGTAVYPLTALNWSLVLLDAVNLKTSVRCRCDAAENGHFPELEHFLKSEGMSFHRSDEGDAGHPGRHLIYDGINTWECPGPTDKPAIPVTQILDMWTNNKAMIFNIAEASTKPVTPLIFEPGLELNAADIRILFKENE
jgi:hypothetical protein